MPEGWRPRGVTPRPRLGMAAERSYPTPEARGSGREDQPHAQGVVAARAQEGRVSDAIQPSHPLSSPSPLALNPSQHQNLFQ